MTCPRDWPSDVVSAARRNAAYTETPWTADTKLQPWLKRPYLLLAPASGRRTTCSLTRWVTDSHADGE